MVRSPEALAISLFGGEDWFERRRRRWKSDETDFFVLNKILEIPEFNSLTSEQQAIALRLCLRLKSEVDAAFLSATSLSTPERMKREIDQLLGVAKNLGLGLTQKIAEVSIESSSEAIGWEEQGPQR